MTTIKFMANGLSTKSSRLYVQSIIRRIGPMTGISCDVSLLYANSSASSYVLQCKATRNVKRRRNVGAEDAIICVRFPPFSRNDDPPSNGIPLSVAV